MSYLDDKIKENISARKAKHNADVRASILQAARRIAIEDGWRKVSIRKIAIQIGYSAPVIYQHFKAGKQEVLRTLQDDGFKILRGFIGKAQETAFEPELLLANISVAYWKFSLDYPELYQVMFNLEGVFVSNTQTTAQLKRAGKPVNESLQKIVAKADVDELFLNWWALIHGYISITMTQQLPNNNMALREKHLRAAAHRLVRSVK